MNDPIQVKVYGANTSGQQMVVDQIKKKLSSANLAFDITEETDVSVFIKKGLESVPAIQYNEGSIFPLKTNGAFNQSLRTSINGILDEYNYGDLPKIIVPTDFSDTSLNALIFAHRLATNINAVTKVLHVYFPKSRDLADATIVNTDYSEVRKSQLDELVSKINLDWGSDLLKASFMGKEFRTGFPAENIIKSVEENNADLVVMGTTGDSNQIKKWFGSVSTKVGMESPAPVLLVPEKSQFKGINNILYAYDQYDLDKNCIQNILPFALLHNANIHFVHVNNKARPNPGYYISEIIGEQYDSSKIIVNQLETQKVSQALNDYALTHNIDLIVLAREHKNFFQKVFDKSVTRELAIHTNLPLLIIKAEN